MRLKDLREDKDLTQSTIASYLNCEQNTYHQYESGKKHISLDLLIKLALFYNTSVDYILELTNNPKPYDRKNKKIV